MSQTKHLHTYYLGEALFDYKLNNRGLDHIDDVKHGVSYLTYDECISLANEVSSISEQIDYNANIVYKLNHKNHEENLS